MDSAFESAVNRFRESLTKSQREQFAHCRKQDVESTILDIQARHGSQKRLKYMRRVSKFVEGMSQLGQVIEVFLNVNNSVAFVWVRTLIHVEKRNRTCLSCVLQGPVKLLLVVNITRALQHKHL